MQKRISHDSGGPQIRVVLITLDRHAAGAVDRVRRELAHTTPHVSLSLHIAADWSSDARALKRCLDDIATGDIIVATMLFMEDHVEAVRAALEARRDACDAMVGMVSAGEIVKLTKLGKFSMAGGQRGPMALLKRLRGASAKKTAKSGSSGAGQMAMLRQIPRLLKFIPGTAQDVRAYVLAMQYYLAGSDDNLANMVRFLINRYAAGERASLRGSMTADAPVVYPDVGLYHPDLEAQVTAARDELPKSGKAGDGASGTVGLLVMRSYVLAGDTGHYDAVIRDLEGRGLRVVTAFASGLDQRPAVERYFIENGRARVDAVVSLTGFSLVGGPAYNDAQAAEELLARLDVPYISAHPLEFQSLEAWRQGDRGLMPVEQTIMVAIPELDGATAPTVFGGRSAALDGRCGGCGHACRLPDPGNPRAMMGCHERVTALGARVEKLIALRRAARADRKLAVVLFNFPPNAGATGTAAFLAVFQSLHNVLKRLAAEGYSVDLPADVDALRRQILEGNCEQYGADANVHAVIPVDDHVRRETHLEEIEATWGPAPGRQLANGAGIQVLGVQFGNVFVGVQPGFGTEGDPMRLLFEKDFAPTHAFSAFYRFLREDFGADAVLHFGTHGALEFMPGKQSGLTDRCWPERLIGDLPNVYLYAGNNPSEGTIAKRRAAATLVTYLTPSVAKAGLYRGLADLKASIDRWRTTPADQFEERAGLARLIEEQAIAVDLIEDAGMTDEAERPTLADAEIATLADGVLELEYTLIPFGLHVVGAVPPRDARRDMLLSVAEASFGLKPRADSVDALIEGATPERAMRSSGLAQDEATKRLFQALARAEAAFASDGELDGIVQALDGRYVRPVSGGDVLRSLDVLPAGRNMHGFDPFRLPSAFALRDGTQQAARLLARHMADGNDLPETVAMVLWGTDNLKSEGGPIGQALALIGAEPRFDSYGRLCGARLIPLEDLKRPRIDVMMTLSGIFRDLLPLQTRMLAEAAFLAASAEEPLEQNFVRRHALAYAERTGCDLEEAALRVFSNADGAYGSNVNQLIDSGAWGDEEELAECYASRKCFAYGRDGSVSANKGLLTGVLATVDVAYQNLESVELGVTTIDHYFDTLGGIGRAVKQARGGRDASVYIGDQTRTEGKVRSLSEQVALETRTRMLNPKWTEGMLAHGYEGVRQIEAHVTNTVGWSATTGQVAPWVYQQISETYVLDAAMRRRISELNPKASAKVAKRLIEAHERNYWNPDEATLEALRDAGDELDDRVEGIGVEAAA